MLFIIVVMFLFSMLAGSISLIYEMVRFEELYREDYKDRKPTCYLGILAIYILYFLCYYKKIDVNVVKATLIVVGASLLFVVLKSFLFHGMREWKGIAVCFCAQLWGEISGILGAIPVVLFVAVIVEIVRYFI